MKSHNEFLVAVSQQRARANSPGLGHGLYLKAGYFCSEISTTLYSTTVFYFPFKHFRGRAQKQSTLSDRKLNSTNLQIEHRFSYK